MFVHFQDQAVRFADVLQTISSQSQKPDRDARDWRCRHRQRHLLSAASTTRRMSSASRMTACASGHSCPNSPDGFLETQQIAARFRSRATKRWRRSLPARVAEEIALLDRLEAFASHRAGRRSDPAGRLVAKRHSTSDATRFQNIVGAQRILGMNPSDGLQGKLRSAVQQFEARVGQLDQPRLTVLLLTMRRLEKDFALSGEERFGDQLNGREADFETALAACRAPRGCEDRAARSRPRLQACLRRLPGLAPDTRRSARRPPQIFRSYPAGADQGRGCGPQPCRTRAAQGRRLQADASAG